MSMNGEYLTMAEAVGEVEPQPIGWVPGVDFDPGDPDEMEIMGHVWGRETADHVARLERENDRLRQALAEQRGWNDD